MPQGTKINIVEQHVEKAVLALCALVMIYTVVHWVIGSPRQANVYGGQPPKRVTISPRRVDEAISQAARAVDEKAKDAPVTTAPPEDYLAKLRAARANPFDVNLENVVAWSQPPTPVTPRVFT